MDKFIATVLSNIGVDAPIMTWNRIWSHSIIVGISYIIATILDKLHIRSSS